MDRIRLTKEIEKILGILNSSGKGYIVGGYVRDSLLKIEPKDCDFSTDIDYERLKVIFKSYSPKEIGKHFGIIQIRYRGVSYEIAKLRKDTEFTKKRNITKVEFVDSLEEDLKRRDFTINAIAFDGKKLFYSSPIGEKDIEDRVLRFVGNPEKRIEEDPLRILRGIRIASEKEVILLEETRLAMLKKRESLKRVSTERIKEELFKILRSKNSVKGLELLYSTRVLEEILPTVSKELQENSKLKQISKLDKEQEQDIISKLALLFIGADKDIDLLKLSNKDRDSLKNITKNFYSIERVKTDYEIKKTIQEMGLDNFLKLIKIKSFYVDLGLLKDRLDAIIERGEAIYLKDLKIDGNDLKKMGIVHGKEIKRALDRFLEIVLKNPELNSKEKLEGILRGKKWAEYQ